MRWIAGLLAAVIVLSVCVISRSEEWPRWRGPAGTGISTESGLADSWPTEGPRRVWSQQVGVGYSSPIALDGKVYLFAQQGTNDVLQAFDARTGAVQWTQSYDRGPDPVYAGTRATPSIDSSHIFTYGSGGDLACRNLADGKQVWRINVLKETGTALNNYGQTSSPLVTADRIYVQCGQGGQCVAVAVDKATGTIAWKSQAKEMGGYAAPVIFTVQQRPELIVFGGHLLYAMDPQTGATLWSQPWKTTYDINAATPVCDGEHLFISSGYNHGAMMLSINAQGQKVDWEKADISCNFQAPILDGATLYANSAGTLKCLSWPDGKLLWAAKGPELRLGNGGTLVRNGNRLIAMSERGKLSLIEATPTSYRLVSQAQVFDHEDVWSTPLIYRGRLYVKGGGELACYDIGATKH